MYGLQGFSYFQVGYYKMHPEIPVEMSERAKQFILRCFEPDPDRRATAAELMEENFLSEFVNFFNHAFTSVKFLCTTVG